MMLFGKCRVLGFSQLLKPTLIIVLFLPAAFLLGCVAHEEPPALAVRTQQHASASTAYAEEPESHERRSADSSTLAYPAPAPTPRPALTWRSGATPAASRLPERQYLPLFVFMPPTRVYFPVITHPWQTPTPTPRPAPTPTPTPPWPEPLEKPGRSKLGIHVEWNNSPDIMEFIRRTKPAVVKAAGDLGFLAEVKQVSPSTVTVARLGQGPQKFEGDPVMAARAFVAQNLEQYQRNPAVDYWEGWNEPDVLGRLDWYAAFEAERARVMAEHGFRVAVGGFSPGVPEWEDFPAFLPAIAAAKKYGGIFTVHEYDAPTLDRSLGAGLPGRPYHPDRGALMLRYRWWYEDFLKPRGLVVPLVISEAGIDGAMGNRPGPEGFGWRDFTGYWASQGLGDDGVQAYIRQLAWYDSQVQQDDYVIGFAVFTAGVITDRWKSFDITDILRNLAIYVVEQQ
ncbi:MAG: hypothetical protein D6791_13365 [Chloroflexi bacterium]|nr:MAG: hypothetical protein D6791_13365 [Chloroflexota bacterium]